MKKQATKKNDKNFAGEVTGDSVLEEGKYGETK